MDEDVFVGFEKCSVRCDKELDITADKIQLFYDKFIFVLAVSLIFSIGFVIGFGVAVWLC